MKMRVISICLLLVSIFISCKKEDLSDGASANQYRPKLTKILINNEADAEYLYNDSSLIRQESNKYDLTINHYNSMAQLTSTEFYANDDILSSDASVSESAMKQTAWVTPASGNKGGVLLFSYNPDGLLLKTTTTRPSSNDTEYSEFSYDSGNKMTRQSMFFADKNTGYIDYAYDSKGNLTSEKLYNLPESGTAELITTITYSFDNQINPYKAFNNSRLPGKYTNANNIVKETYTIHIPSDQGSDKVEVTENSYEYNALGYPVTKNGNVKYIY